MLRLKKIKNPTLWISYTALMTALTAVATLVISVPSLSGGHTNLSDAVIFITAVLLDPLAAFIAGGLGTFIADLLVYPTTMVFSLIFHGVEGLVVGILIAFCSPKSGKTRYILNAIYMLIGGIIMITGFYFAKAFYYGNPETALISLWRNVLQVVISIAVSYLLLYPLKLEKLINRDKLYAPFKSSETKNENINDNRL